MKRKPQLTVSSLAAVIAIAPFIFFGTPTSDAIASSAANELFVDRDQGRLDGACTKNDPCARITDALTKARAMRYGFNPAIGRLKSNERIKITVSASASPYLGSPDPTRVAQDASLEALPLFINISDLDLVGESKFSTDDEGWIEENSLVRDTTTIKSETPLPGNVALILIGISQGMPADDVNIRGFVLDGSAPLDSGFLVVVDRAHRFAIHDVSAINATYGVGTQGASGVVEQCFMTQLGEGVLVFGGNSTNWPSEVTVRDTRSIKNAFGGLVFFGSAFAPNDSFPPLADFGAYTGVFQPVPFDGVRDKTVGRVIHNDLSQNSATPTSTSGLRMALIGPNLPDGQSAGHLFMTVTGNRLNDNAHAFIIDAGFPFRAATTNFTGSFTGRFENNEATGSLTAKALVTFTRNNAAETLPRSMAVWKYLVDSRYQLIYSSGEFDDTPEPNGHVWIDNPSVDPGDQSRALNNELIIQAE
jgi:hypothetical protein